MAGKYYYMSIFETMMLFVLTMTLHFNPFVNNRTEQRRCTAYIQRVYECDFADAAAVHSTQLTWLIAGLKLLLS